MGISLDGPRELHDRYRLDKLGKPTFADVHRGLKLLKEHEIEFNALVTVNRRNGDHGKKIYTYLRDNGVQHLQFIPIVERENGTSRTTKPIDEETNWDRLVSNRTLRPQQWGNFLVAVFDEWIKRDVGKVFVQIFDQALSAWMGIEPSLCIFRKNCGRAVALEHNGDLFSGDRFVEPDFLLGNLAETSIKELANS